jgi:Zn-dependent protease
MHRLTIFLTLAALTGVWLYLSLRVNKRSLGIDRANWVQPDEGMLKGCFPWSVYYLQSLEYRDESVICRGNLRSSSNLAYNLIKDNVTKTFGDRFLVLLQEEPSLNQLDPSELDQEEVRKYVFAVVPNFNPQFPFAQIKLQPEWLLWISSVLMGLLPLGLFSVYGSTFDLSVQVLATVPILIVILSLREFARRWTANRYGIKISLPYFTPNLGGIVWHKSHIPNRKALFDLAIAPNIVGLILSLVLVLWGMLQPLTLGMEFDFKVSILMHGLNHILPNTDHEAIHPVAYIGWWGLNLNALSLIPVSILDGGYILRSMVGKLAIAAPVMRMVVLGLGLVSQQWLLVVAVQLFLLNYPQSSPFDDVTELNLGRDILGIIVLGLALAVILPVPEFLELT